MELQYYGANCVRITSKKAAITIDDTLADLGLKSITKKDDIVLFTAVHGTPATDVKILVDQPGEYEVSNISIQGVAARAHIDEDKQQTATMYKLIVDDTRIVVLGHIYPDLNEQQLEALGTVDVLIIPVGGNGYTLDPIGAAKIIRKIEPKVVIPTHFDDPAIKYVVPQQSLEDALKGLAMEPHETVSKYKLKLNEMADSTQLVVLERQ